MHVTEHKGFRIVVSIDDPYYQIIATGYGWIISKSDIGDWEVGLIAFKAFLDTKTFPHEGDQRHPQCKLFDEEVK